MKTRSLRTLLTVIVLALLASAQAGPAAYVERNAYAQFGYQFAPASLIGALGAELPLELGLPIDVGLGAQLDFNGALGGTVYAKALVFPSLLGNPPLALALGTDLRLYNANGALGWRSRLGLIGSFDFDQLVLSISPMFGFGFGGAALEIDAGVRYYLDPLAFELNLSYSTLGSFAAQFGLRFLF